MDDFNLNDTKRMINAIIHECSLRIKEIKLEAAEAYDVIKSDTIVEKEKELYDIFAKEAKQIKKKELVYESKIRLRHKINMGLIKEKLYNGIIEEVKSRIKQYPMNVNLIEQIAKKVEIKDCIVFAKGSAYPIIEKELAKYSINFEFKELPDEFLGGIVLISKDGKEIWDNSYLSRIEALKKSHSHLVSKELFNK